MRRLLLLMTAAMLLAGCRSVRYVEVEKVRTDTTYVTKLHRDSIFKHDSIYVHEWLRGDTVFVEKAVWRTVVQERLRVDTMYRSHVDSIPVPYPVEKLVEKQLTWWQQARMHTGGIVIFLAIALLGWKYLLPLLRKLL